MKSGLTFLIAARQCEIVELEQLMRTSSLVNLLGHLIHVLQKERGLSNIYLSSGGSRGADARLEQIEECLAVEHEAREAFDVLDTGISKVGNGLGSGFGNGARLFSRIAYVLQGLDALPGLRQQIGEQQISAEVATSSFVTLIAGLLAVVFEAADSATDPEISRLLVAMFNFMQGKEFAGQERATGVAAFGSGRSDQARLATWLHLIDSQDRCFKVFTEFSEPMPLTLWLGCTTGEFMGQLERMRRIGCTAMSGATLDVELAQTWFDCCTRRMDAMHKVEAQLAKGLLEMCEQKISDARAELIHHRALLSTSATPPLSDFFGGADSGVTIQSYGRHLDRSVLELVQEQSQRMQAMRDELDTVRASLNERKIVERAKGLLMAHRQLSEGDAHKMLRDTAMNQNRRLIDVAEAVLSMSDLLPHQPVAQRT